jgi:hypothetical protein
MRIAKGVPKPVPGSTSNADVGEIPAIFFIAPGLAALALVAVAVHAVKKRLGRAAYTPVIE